MKDDKTPSVKETQQPAQPLDDAQLDKAQGGYEKIEWTYTDQRKPGEIGNILDKSSTKIGDN